MLKLSLLLLLLLPHFLWGLVGEVLVQTHGVVPVLELIEQALQVLCVVNGGGVEVLFESAKQTFDSSVLPGAVQVNALVADVGASQCAAKHWACKAGFVIGADGARMAMLLCGSLQMLDEMLAVLAADEQAQELAAAMV